ncbi:MAG: histidine phosphatase family protein [Muribaculaceae bacterium]|nr:histidine phosphatase family protein [Muribaculaceae bacterium]
MKRLRLLMAAMAVASCFIGNAATETEMMVAACPEKAGGIYYAYDVTQDSVVSQPEGYVPVYISHYGRHGSRWPVNQKIYKTTGDFFQEQQLAENLTPEGRGLWKMVTRCAGNAHGHLGELTDKGALQHRAIADRMLKRFPTLFTRGSVVARSSVEPRCIMSMMAFCDRLEETVPELRISKHASPGDMDFIHHNTPEAKLNTGDDAPWMWDFSNRRDSLTRAAKTAAKLFKNVPQTDSLPIFMRSLYDVAISVQDIDTLDVDLLSVFEVNELAGLWKAANYMQYVANGKSPESMSAGTESVKPLLAEIVARADEMLASGDVKVDLRFGHDTDLLRLVSLIDADGLGVELEDTEAVAEKWRNFEISPMGGNFQLVYYRNRDGNVLVMPRLNEVPVTISDVPAAYPGFYDWEILKNYFSTL